MRTTSARLFVWRNRQSPRPNDTALASFVDTVEEQELVGGLSGPSMSDRHRPFFIDLFAIGGLSKKKLPPLTPTTMSLRAHRASVMRTVMTREIVFMSLTADIPHHGR